MRKQAGFTLIELLIVLAILGILVGIVTMSVGDLQATAVARAKSVEKQTVQTAIDTYNTQDVAVDGSSNTIPEQKNAAAVPDGDGSKSPYFNKYLKTATKYTYTWDANGANLAVQ
jgi:prepilin-type N-terminal cleavage/methylation domain-containing protein